MRLVVFDVDGTLTDTMAVDARCFLRTFEDVCGFVDVDDDWSHYKNATDAGIYHEVFESRMGRAPTEAETSRFRKHLVALFRAAAQQQPFVPVLGAADLLARLGRETACRVALATGCWSDSARIKMASAGMRYDDYPSASADDAPERQTIIKLAIERSRRFAGEIFSSAVYVGDGVWDGRACRGLGIPFIGIGASEQARKLSAEGAVHVFGNLTDGDGFLQILEGMEK